MYSIVPINGGIDGYAGVGPATFGAGDYDVWIFKLNQDGSLAWQNAYGGGQADIANSITLTSDGGYIVAGYSMSFGAGRSDAWVLKLNGSGNLIWQKTYGDAFDDYASSIAPINGGENGYVVAGYTGSIPASQGIDDAWLFMVDTTGNMVWSKTFGGSSQDLFYSVALTSDGGYIVSGFSGSIGGEWVLKLDANGNFNSQCSLGTSFSANTGATPVSLSVLGPTPLNSIATPAISNATPNPFELQVIVQCEQSTTTPTPSNTPTNTPTATPTFTPTNTATSTPTLRGIYLPLILK